MNFQAYILGKATCPTVRIALSQATMTLPSPYTPLFFHFNFVIPLFPDVI